MRRVTVCLLIVSCLLFACLTAAGCAKDPFADLSDDIRIALENSLEDVFPPFQESVNSELGPAQEVVISKQDGDLFFAVVRHKEGFSKTILRESQSEWKRLCGEGREELNQWWDWGNSPGRDLDIEVVNLFLEDGVTLIVAGWTCGLYPKMTVVFEKGSRTYELPNKEGTFCLVDRNTPGAAERGFAVDPKGNQKNTTGFRRDDYGGGMDGLR